MTRSRLTALIVLVLWVATSLQWFNSWVAILGAVLIVAIGLRLSRPAAAHRQDVDSYVGGASGSDFLCDSCKYNHPNTCSIPERPNLTRCDDYRPRGG